MTHVLSGKRYTQSLARILAAPAQILIKVDTRPPHPTCQCVACRSKRGET